MALSTYSYEQLGLRSGMEPLTEKEKQILEESWASVFASEIFPCIDEMLFVPLFREGRTRRNVPVNVLVGAMLLQELRQMPDEELVEAAMFDLRIRTALHITQAVGQPFSRRTLQRFRTNLKRYREKAGVDLLAECLTSIGGSLSAYVRRFGKNTPYFALTKIPGSPSKKGAPDSGAGRGTGELADGKEWKPGQAAPALTAALRAAMEQIPCFDPAVVADPEIFEENRLPAHSDHVFFADEKEMAAGADEPAGTAAPSALRLSLNGLWKYSCAERPQDAPQGFEEVSFDCRGWADIRVPEHIRMEEHDVPIKNTSRYPWDGREDIVPGQIPEQFNPTASYIKYFSVPEKMREYLAGGSPLYISFQGVESGFALWCNGNYVGYSEGSFSPSEFDLTPFIDAEGENKLAVRAFKWTASSWLESRDFLPFSGIFRDVWLYTVPRAHLYDLRIRPLADESLAEGTLEIGARIRLYGEALRLHRANCSKLAQKEQPSGHLVMTYSLCREGREILGGAVPLPDLPDPYQLPENAGGIAAAETKSAQLTLSFVEKIEKPVLWSAEDPQLYELTLRLACEEDPGQGVPGGVSGEGLSGKEVSREDESREDAGDGAVRRTLLEVVREKIGFRRFEMKDGQMCLNGKRIVFRGVNGQEFSCDSGRTVSAGLTRRDLILMKQNNINAVRACLYPDAPALSRLCDELGLYLIAETVLEPCAAGGPQDEAGLPSPGIIPVDDEEWRGFLLDRVDSCYQRDKNHPSILIWSPGCKPSGETVIRDMAERFRALDPDRLVYDEETHPYSDLTDGEPGYQGGFIRDAACQPIRFQVGRDSVRIINDNLFTGTESFDCTVLLEIEGKKAAEAALETAVPALSEAVYALPQAILRRISELEEGSGEPVFSGTGASIETAEPETTGQVTGKQITAAGKTAEQETGKQLTGEREAAEQETVKQITGEQETAEQVRDTAYVDAAESRKQTEYAVTVSMCLREDRPWASKGSEIAFGQGVFLTGAVSSADRQGTVGGGTPSGRIGLTRGSCNIGIRGEHFDALFSLLKGELISFRRGGNPFAGYGTGGSFHLSGAGRRGFAAGELFEKMPRPCFWRAPTGKDAGNRVAAGAGIWKLAEEYQIPRPETLQVFEEEDSVLLQIRYALPLLFSQNVTAEACPSVTIGYRFSADGKLTLSMDWDPAQSAAGLPPMPLFGFSFCLNAGLDRFTYYGNGPDGNYPGRNRGARLGIFEGTVKDNLSPCPVPQECGNRTGVRWAEVTDDLGRGLRFSAGKARGSEGEGLVSGPCVECPDKERSGMGLPGMLRPCMEFSVLPYTPQELENAARSYELPPVHYTHVRCCLSQTGSAGEDSRGVPTFPQNCLPADRPLHFEVTVEEI